MSGFSMGASKQVVRPPQRGIFPLDHFAECRTAMEDYLSCLKENEDTHHKCRDLSKDYLQCRMDRELMSKEDLNSLGYGKDTDVKGAKEYDNAKEKRGFVGGTYTDREKEATKWWFQSSRK